MRIYKKVLITSILFATFLGVAVMAQSSPITDKQIDHILANCSSTEATLNQLHASDALLRVNMGQIYESMSTKLMDSFNERVKNNKYSNDDLVSITNSYNTVLNDFRLSYKTYEEHLSLAIKIDCKKQPVSFFDAVSLARNDRIKVHNNIVKLNQLVDQYQSAVAQFEKNYNDAVDGLSN